MAEHTLRSDCPLNFAVEIFGDKWSLLLIRDMLLLGKATYNELLESPEKIATNILSSRLKMLEEAGIIQKQHDPTRKTKTKYIYLLTPRGVDLIPVVLEMMLWSEAHWPLTKASTPPIVNEAKHNKQRVIDELHQAVEARIAATRQSSHLA